MSMALPPIVADRFQRFRETLSFGPESQVRTLDMNKAAFHFLDLDHAVAEITSRDQGGDDIDKIPSRVTLSPAALASLKGEFDGVKAEFEGEPRYPQSALIEKTRGETTIYQWTGFLPEVRRRADVMALVNPQGIEFAATSMNYYGHIAESATLK